MLEQEGLFFLQPIYNLLFGHVFNDFLNLPRSSVSVCYKTYHNTYKGRHIDPNDLSLQEAVDKGLTPGNILILGQVRLLFKLLLLTLMAVCMQWYWTMFKR